MFKAASFVSVDVETKHLDKDQIEFESQFVKHHPSTKDPVKQQAQIDEKINSLITRGPLTDSAEIASIAISAPDVSDKPIVLHTFPFEDELDGLVHSGFASEKTMLQEFRSFVNTCTNEETEIIGANVSFDLAKFRYRAIVNRTMYPEFLRPGALNPVVDVTRIIGKYFLINGSAEYNLSFAEAIARFGIRSDGKVVTGAEIPDMINEKKYAEVITYNATDAVDAMRLYLLITGQQL